MGDWKRAGIGRYQSRVPSRPNRASTLRLPCFFFFFFLFGFMAAWEKEKAGTAGRGGAWSSATRLLLVLHVAASFAASWSETYAKPLHKFPASSGGRVAAGTVYDQHWQEVDTCSSAVTSVAIPQRLASFFSLPFLIICEMTPLPPT